MTAEFPDTSLAELEERRALLAEEQEELAEMSLADLEAERGQREDQLERCRAQCLITEGRIMERRLWALQAEIERRGHW
ncbi:MAG TPA: hypothetical protein VN969_05110 [Streptosporangiaceae bacterium]|jgi:hypothetical protein|nr:hypothetical protein [Streptosporangiaceae bacterium]